MCLTCFVFEASHPTFYFMHHTKITWYYSFVLEAPRDTIAMQILFLILSSSGEIDKSLIFQRKAKLHRFKFWFQSWCFGNYPIATLIVLTMPQSITAGMGARKFSCPNVGYTSQAAKTSTSTSKITASHARLKTAVTQAKEVNPIIC